MPYFRTPKGLGQAPPDYNSPHVTPQFRPVSWPATAGLLALLSLGMFLRLWGIGAGAPYRMGVDEPVILENTLRMVKTGDFHPRFFDYGGLNFYLHTAVSSVAFLKGAMDGKWRSLDPLWIGDILEPTRIATALIGSLTILIVFRIGLRWGEPVALVATLAMAVLPAHVRESHFTLTDTPLTFFTTVTLLWSLRAAESRELRAIALAGLGVGLATAIKYNGFIALVMPLTAVWAFPRERRLAALALATATAIGGFVLAAPYSLFDLPGFLNAFAFLMQSYNLPRPAGEAAWIYIRHLRNWFSWPGVLPLEFGYIALTLLTVGLVTAYRRVTAPTPRSAGLVLAIFPLVYLVYVSYQGSLIYGRYLLPIAPMLTVAFAVGLTALAARLTRRWSVLEGRALPLLLLLLIGPQMAAAVSWNREHIRRTTLDQAASWLLNRTDAGQPIVMEGGAIQLPPRVVLRRVRRLIDKTFEQYEAEGTVYLVTSTEVSSVYEADPAGHAEDLAKHKALISRADIVQTFPTSTTRPGPTLTVLKLRP